MSARRRHVPAQLQAGLVVTGFRVFSADASFAGATVKAIVAKAVCVVIEAIVDHGSPDALLSWNPAHPFIAANIGRPTRVDTGAQELASQLATVTSERDRARADGVAQSRENEQLRRLIALMRPARLAQRSEAFPAPVSRFSWLEVD